MKHSVKDILCFLFPEWQIIEAMKEEGVVAKRLDKLDVQSIQEQTVSTKQQEITPGVAKSEKLGADEVQTKNPISRDAVKEIPQKIERKYKSVFERLQSQWLASESEVIALVQAFLRPFVVGAEEGMPKNTILLVGDDGRGKTNAIKVVAKILKDEHFLDEERVSIMDCAHYSLEADEELFLSDLYKALYDASEIVVFKNIERADFKSLEIISQLTQNGTYRLQKRYIHQNGMLFDASGVLNTSTISELKSEGKYLVFTSDVSVNQVAEHCSSTFMNALNDVITLEPMSSEQLERLINSRVVALIEQAERHLKLALRCHESCHIALRRSYYSAKGIRGLERIIDEDIYKALKEYRLMHPVRKVEDARLYYEEGFKLSINDRVIALDDYIRKYDSQALERVKAELGDVIGLSSVKEYVNSLENNLKAQQLRAQQGLKTADISMHMIFTGNPGTGKTTIARIVAKYLKALGMLTTGQLREVSRTDLVGQYAGHTARLTNEVIQSALGGVLFIDEAYALCRDQSDTFGLEAIDALVKGMEDHRDQLVVILAGYADEMEAFLKKNPGLRSRFPNIIEFEDYTPSEMLEIAQVTVKNKGYRIADDCIPLLADVFEHKQLKGRNDNGNGRLVRNMVEAAILNQSQRIVQVPTQDLTLLTKEDFELQEKPDFDLEATLSKIVGLEDVKDFMRGLEARLYVQEARKKHGLKVDYSQTLHMIFTGNPGTGKTMMARIAANILYQMGVISTNRIVETDRSGLVAGYVGQTAMKTQAVIESAFNGVLFIDEAYALAQGGPNDFGQEAIDILVKMMDDHRDHLVVILAGYSDEMQHFLAQNAGLASRFPHVIEFEDYSTEELMQIAQGMYAEQGYVLPEDAVALLRNSFDEIKTQPHFGNGRFVRNLFEKSLNQQALRLACTKEMSVEALSIITAEDIKEVLE